MKRGSIVFIILVLSTLGLGSISSVSAGIFYQNLNAGDELLYKEHIHHEYAYDHTYWSELKTDPMFYSYKENIFYEWDGDAVKSYNINWASDSNGNYNSTTTSYDYYGYDYSRHESYDYQLDTWFMDHENDYYWDNDNVDSYYDIYHGMDVYNDTLNFDPYYYFGSTSYFSTFIENYTINSLEQGFIVDVYVFEYNYTNNWVESFFNAFYDVEGYEEYTYYYYVDRDTGFLLQYEIVSELWSDGYFYGYSTDLGCNVEIDIQNHEMTVVKGKLFETTSAFFPVMDASLPLALVQNYPVMYNGTVVVPIEVILQDSSNDMMVEIYVNDILYSTYHHLMSGYYIFDVFEADLPFYGTYYTHDIDFVVYDEFNFEHNSTWWTCIYDERYVIPDWPSWMEGPDYIEIKENENLEVMFRINSDTSWELEIFKDEGFGFFSYDYHSGHKTSDILLCDYGLTVGDYYYKLQLIDVVNVTYEIILHVHVNPADAPVIMGPTGDYYYDVGTGETLSYQFQDNNPTYYTVWLDDNKILAGDYSDGDWISFELDSYIFTNGTYHLMLEAFDNDGYRTEIHLKIYAIGDNIITSTITTTAPTITATNTTETTETDDTTTIGLDAPNALIALLGVLSVSGLAIILKRRR